MNRYNLVDCLLIVAGTAYSIENFESILGIVILVLQCVWVVAKLLLLVKDKWKKKTGIKEFVEDVDKLVDDTTEDLRNVAKKK